MFGGKVVILPSEGGFRSWRVSKPAGVPQWSESMPLLGSYDSYDSFVAAFVIDLSFPFQRASPLPPEGLSVLPLPPVAE